jgi:alcohol dehydrogenase
MRELIYEGPNALAWREAAEPTVRGAPAGAVVRPIAATPCDLDRAIVAGRTPLPPPFALGHECVAEVVAVGDEVRRVRVGDVVVVPWHLACGACERCRRGLTASCARVPPLAMYGAPLGGHHGGLFSELVAVPFADAMLVRLPDGVSSAQAASASDNLTDAWAAISRALDEHPAARVLVVGGVGAIGLFAVELAGAAGASGVDYVDKPGDRLALAESLGARVVERGAALPEPGGYEVVIDASGHPAELRRALGALAPGGLCHILGIYFAETPLPLIDLYAKDVTIRTGRSSVGPRIPEVLALLAAGRIRPERVTGAPHPFDAAPDVLRARHLKPVLVRPRIT